MTQRKKAARRKPSAAASKSKKISKRSRKALTMDPILSLSGLGKEIWKGIDADQYVKELRESWD